MTAVCWVNGVESGAIDTLDRGLHYGDGLFETLAVENRRIGLLDYHLERLAQGCERLGIQAFSSSALRTELGQAADIPGRAVLKIIVTRGSGGRGYAAPRNATPTRILLRYPWVDYPPANAESGVRLRICETRLSGNAKLAGLKHLNRLEQVLARSEWNPGDGVAEGLMLDEDDLVIEGTMSNVFMGLANGELITPALERCGVAGVMRRHLLEQAAAAGVVTRIADTRLADMMQAREIFMCNSLIGVWPVAVLEGREWVPGVLTRRAQEWARQALGRET